MVIDSPPYATHMQHSKSQTLYFRAFSTLKTLVLVLKEMDYLMRMQDEQEEERYKKLDEIIRKSQETRKENATVTEKGIISRFQNKLLHRRTT